MVLSRMKVINAAWLLICLLNIILVEGQTTLPASSKDDQSPQVVTKTRVNKINIPLHRRHFGYDYTGFEETTLDYVEQYTTKKTTIGTNGNNGTKETKVSTTTSSPAAVQLVSAITAVNDQDNKTPEHQRQIVSRTSLDSEFSELNKIKHQIGDGYLSAGIVYMLRIIAEKTPVQIANITFALLTNIKRQNKGEKLNIFKELLGTILADLFELIATAPADKIKAQAFYFIQAIQNRNTEFYHDTNHIFDITNAYFNEKNARNFVTFLKHLKEYPKGHLSEDELSAEFMDLFASHSALAAPNGKSLHVDQPFKREMDYSLFRRHGNGNQKSNRMDSTKPAYKTVHNSVSQKTTSHQEIGIYTRRFNSPATITRKTVSPSTLGQNLLLSELNNIKNQIGDGYLTAGIVYILKIIAEKTPVQIANLTYALVSNIKSVQNEDTAVGTRDRSTTQKHGVTSGNCCFRQSKGEKLNIFKEFLGSIIAELLEIIATTPSEKIKAQTMYYIHIIEDRRKEFYHDTNKLFDVANAWFSEKNVPSLVTFLKHLKAFPNGPRSVDELSTEFTDLFIFNPEVFPTKGTPIVVDIPKAARRKLDYSVLRSHSNGNQKFNKMDSTKQSLKSVQNSISQKTTFRQEVGFYSRPTLASTRITHNNFITFKTLTRRPKNILGLNEIKSNITNLSDNSNIKRNISNKITNNKRFMPFQRYSNRKFKKNFNKHVPVKFLSLDKQINESKKFDTDKKVKNVTFHNANDTKKEIKFESSRYLNNKFKENNQKQKRIDFKTDFAYKKDGKRKKYSNVNKTKSITKKSIYVTYPFIDINHESLKIRRKVQDQYKKNNTSDRDFSFNKYNGNFKKKFENKYKIKFHRSSELKEPATLQSSSSKERQAKIQTDMLDHLVHKHNSSFAVDKRAQKKLYSVESDDEVLLKKKIYKSLGYKSDFADGIKNNNF